MIEGYNSAAAGRPNVVHGERRASRARWPWYAKEYLYRVRTLLVATYTLIVSSNEYECTVDARPYAAEADVMRNVQCGEERP